jgi:hypothetical protein
MQSRNRLNPEDSNSFIHDLCESGNPFSVSRVGLGGETLVTYAVKMGMEVPGNYRHWLHNNAGFYGSTDYQRFANLYHQALLDSDAHAYWATGNIFQEAEDFLVPADRILLDPASLESFRFQSPWTKALAGKKVLVIHPFTHTISSQLESKKDNIWKNQDVLGGIEWMLYKSVQSIGGIGPDGDWFNSLDIMKKNISELDFDVALLGCGAYGIPLMGWIKSEMKKSAIYVGGGLQLYFGIKGQRWDRSPDVAAMYNEHWTRCSQQEKPQHINMAGDEASYF